MFSKASFLSLLTLFRYAEETVAFGGVPSSQRRVFVSTPTSNWPKRTVGDCMSLAPLVLEPAQNVDDAMSLLFRSGVHGAPVVNDDQELVGFVSTFDFLPKEAFEGALLPMDMAGSKENVQRYVEAAKKICGRKVEDVMSSSIVTVTPDTTMRQAAAEMTEFRLHHLPVVADDESRKLVGVISSGDVMRDLLHIVRNLPEAKEEAELDGSASP